MKKVLLIALLLISGATYAQNVGIGTSNPDESAILDLQTTNKGFLLPRLTEKQKNLIPTPAEGLMIYQTDTNNQGVYLFQSGSWKNIGSANVTTSGTTANAVTAYTPNYLLTSDGSGNAISSGVYVNPTNGNVGIGNNTPDLKITISSSTALGTALGFYNSVNTANNRNWTISTNFQTYGDFAIRQSNLIFGNPITDGAIRFYISPIGNFGVGTAGPTEKLDVNGSIRQRAFVSKLVKADANGKFVEAVAGVDYQSPISNPTTITGSTGYIGRIANSTSIANSTIYASGDNLGVGTTVPNHLLTLNSSLGPTTALGLYNDVNLTSNRNWTISTNSQTYGDFAIRQSNAAAGNPITNGTIRFYIGPTGNFGVGTAGPTARLHVNGNIRQTEVSNAIIKADINGNLVAAVAGTDFVVPGSSAFVQGTGTTNYLPKFSATGTVTNSVIAETSTNIGIGTATPAQKLDVVGSIQQSAVKSSVVKVDANGKFVAAVAGTDYVAPGSAAFVQGTGTTNYLSKFSATGTVANSVVAEVSSNIGIGTATPSQKLDVVGSIQQSAVKSSLLGTDANGKLVASLAITEAANSGTENAVKVNSKSTGYLAVGDFGATTPMNIPAGYRLVVQDGIITEKVKVAIRNQTDWADYVFEPTYSLMPLNEVEKFVKENKHLPNVPSADEMVEKGVEVGKTSKMFMEKIEELTLYMIEMKKEIEALKAENAKLRK